MSSIRAHTRPSGDKPNEDWYLATDELVIVLDGATIRTDTGCVHGLPWYVHQLGAALLTACQHRELALRDCIARAIEHVSALHRDTCDLTHPGTPSAATGIARRNGDQWEWASLGDVTVLVETDGGVEVTSDVRVSSIGLAERQECDRHLLGTDAKMAAIQAMKPVELANRNVPGGYWVASVDPDAAQHAYTGSAPVEKVLRLAVCSDGAMRALQLTSISTPEAVLDVARRMGPVKLIDQVRRAEQTDELGRRVPRNKAYDDATCVVVETVDAPPAPPELSAEQRREVIKAATARSNSPNLFGATPTRDGRVL